MDPSSWTVLGPTEMGPDHPTAYASRSVSNTHLDNHAQAKEHAGGRYLGHGGTTLEEDIQAIK